MNYFFKWHLLHKFGKLMNLCKKDIYQSMKAHLYGNIMDYTAHNQIILNILFLMMVIENL